MSIENNENLNQEVKESIPKLWVKKDGLGFSVMELQDFGKFLIGRAEHREGKMICLQMNHEDPLEVRFFSDESNKTDDICHIKVDYKTKSFQVTIAQGTSERISVMLQEFGFIPRA